MKIDHLGEALISSAAFAALGIVVFSLTFWIITKVAPFSIIKEINEQGTTVLLVEQNAAQALKAAHQAHVLETGELVRSGTGAELAGDDSVRAAYLGGDI